MIVADVEQARSGESERLEFKTSTGQLNRAAETLCAFLNADGGQVLFGRFESDVGDHARL